MSGTEWPDEIARSRKEWEEGTLRQSLERFGASQSPNTFYTPADVKGFDFLEKVGFPGQYPFTSGKYPAPLLANAAVLAFSGEVPSQVIRAGRYSGYGAPEDTRDYYKGAQALGYLTGPNIAFDLPTQHGYDSDDPLAQGEVGKVGVAVDTLRDFEVIYEAFGGPLELDRIASSFTINAPTNVILAMYIAVAEKRGIHQSKLRGTPQNDILKEYVARGTQIFPPGPSMRMIRDTIVYCTENVPLMNTISISGYHMREAGAGLAQTIGFTLANAIAYVNLGVEAGLDVDRFVRRFTFLTFGGSMEVFHEVAARRAARRVWARIMRERFGAKDDRNCILRDLGVVSAAHVTTAQRPLNNLTRSVLGGVASALAGDIPVCHPPYDEPLGLGWSSEAQQLSEDATKILLNEAKLCEVVDPLAGSYYVEHLTDSYEDDIVRIIDTIDAMGGAAAAVENGYVQQEIARAAYLYQREVESGERVIVGVNRFTGEDQLEVTTTRLVPHPYDPVRRAKAEKKQLVNLREVKRNRDNGEVEACLKRLGEAAADRTANTVPPILEAVKSYASIGEICTVLREVFGEYQPSSLSV